MLWLTVSCNQGDSIDLAIPAIALALGIRFGTARTSSRLDTRMYTCTYTCMCGLCTVHVCHAMDAWDVGWHMAYNIVAGPLVAWIHPVHCHGLVA